MKIDENQPSKALEKALNSLCFWLLLAGRREKASFPLRFARVGEHGKFNGKGVIPKSFRKDFRIIPGARSPKHAFKEFSKIFQPCQGRCAYGPPSMLNAGFHPGWSLS